MKKLLTIYDLAVGLIAALGYGFGFEIPKLMGYSIWLSAIICLVVGMLVEDMVKKIVFSRAVQKKKLAPFYGTCCDCCSVPGRAVFCYGIYENGSV